MSTSLKLDFQVAAADVDPSGFARPSAILNYLQDAATAAAVSLHVSRPEIIEKYNCFWMIARMWVRLDQPLRLNDTLTVHTWHRGARGASSYRDFDLIRDGEVIGEAVSMWVLADQHNFSLMRMDRLEEFKDTDGGALCKNIKLHRAKLPANLPDRSDRLMRQSDTDVNGHVNNTKYADFACDALLLDENLNGRFIREFQLSYIGQCMAGETITIESGNDADTCWARGVDADGQDRFEGVFHLAPIP